MVFTHLPSAIFLSLIPVPTTVVPAMIFFLLRYSTSSMDTVPRIAFIASIVHSHERTAIMGFVNVTKSFAQSLAPVITGVLVANHRFWVVFVAAGTLKATYDLGLLATFVGHKTHDDKAEEERIEEEERRRTATAAEDEDEADR
jgi:MFS family permease